MRTVHSRFIQRHAVDILRAAKTKFISPHHCQHSRLYHRDGVYNCVSDLCAEEGKGKMFVCI
jgi:hypothetical protein